ncbi:hypothetical protein [Elizabethkingia ursingii]
MFDNKGILLSGLIGSGKTTLFKILRHCSFPAENYGIVSTRNIVSEFMREGYEILENTQTESRIIINKNQDIFTSMI